MLLIAWLITTFKMLLKLSSVLASYTLPMHFSWSKSIPGPTPTINGFSVMPLEANALATAQGSSSQASIPSVIRIITLRTPSPTLGKSSAEYCKERAIGVVPFGVSPLIFDFILSILASPGANGTSSFVSSQSCCPGKICV